MADIYEQFDRGLYKIGVSTYSPDLPATQISANSLFSVTADEISQTPVSGATTIIQQQAGGTAAGKTQFNNTETGYILGIDSSVPKFYIGNTTNYLNWTGTQLIISGNITATTGSIGGFTIGANALYAGDGATKIQLDTTQGIFLGANTLAASPFSVSLAGALIATNATITGAITATSGSFTGSITSTSGTIGGFTINATSISTGAFDTLNTMYFGTSGLSLSNTFKVTPAGVLTATNATITGAITATSGQIGGTTITDTTLYGGIIQTSATVGEGSNGVILDSDGLRGYNGPPDYLGLVFNLPTDGSPPTFASGTINETTFNITNAAVIQTSTTVGDGSTSSAGILINNAGIFACEASQLLADANVKILIDGSAVIKMNVKGGQTDFNTGTGYFLGSSGGDYKLSIGSPAGNYLTWDGTFLKLKGSLDVGAEGLINNSVYTNATLPVSPQVTAFLVPSAYE